MNPFRYGQVVSKKDFCPRPVLSRQLSGFLKSGQNVVLQGERRIGKTSLIVETTRKLRGRRLLYIDLLEIKTIDDLAKRIVAAIISMEHQSGLLEKALRSLSQLRPTVAIDPISGQPSISIDTSTTLRPDSLTGLLDLMADLNRHKCLVVAFDEFQDILNLPRAAETLAILRSKIQFHTEIPYLFSGSVRNQMRDIFTNPDSAFFKSAISLDVGPLPEKTFLKFLTARFESGRRGLEPGLLNQVLELADNIPGDVQELCACLWDTTSSGQSLCSQDLGSALELIYARESKGYEATLVHLSAQQLKCLTGLARMGGDAPLSAAFLKNVGITLPASVRKALSRLVQTKIVYRYDNQYKFVNPFFKTWLVWKNY
jgi:hypothetical protein